MNTYTAECRVWNKAHGYTEDHTFRFMIHDSLHPFEQWNRIANQFSTQVEDWFERAKSEDDEESWFIDADSPNDFILLSIDSWELLEGQP